MNRVVPLAALAVLTLATTAPAQTSDALSSHGRGCAILPPLEAPDAPPKKPKPLFIPWYAPATPLSMRWRSTCYVPYYCGYCPTKHPADGTVPYGEPPVVGEPGPAAAGYGPFTGGPADPERLKHLGGTGPYVPTRPGVPDFLDGPHGLPPQ